jgi:hypothetical protein
MNDHTTDLTESPEQELIISYERAIADNAWLIPSPYNSSRRIPALMTDDVLGQRMWISIEHLAAEFGMSRRLNGPAFPEGHFPSLLRPYTDAHGNTRHVELVLWSAIHRWLYQIKQEHLPQAALPFLRHAILNTDLSSYPEGNIAFWNKPMEWLEECYPAFSAFHTTPYVPRLRRFER